MAMHPAAWALDSRDDPSHAQATRRSSRKFKKIIENPLKLRLGFLDFRVPAVHDFRYAWIVNILVFGCLFGLPNFIKLRFPRTSN